MSKQDIYTKLDEIRDLVERLAPPAVDPEFGFDGRYLSIPWPVDAVAIRSESDGDVNPTGRWNDGRLDLSDIRFPLLAQVHNGKFIYSLWIHDTTPWTEFPVNDLNTFDIWAPEGQWPRTHDASGFDQVGSSIISGTRYIKWRMRGTSEPVQPPMDPRGFLWKPISERGQLVVLTPPWMTAPYDGRMEVYAAGEKLAYTSIANGERMHFRGKKPGGQYPSPTTLEARVPGWTFRWSISRPADRIENLEYKIIKGDGEPDPPNSKAVFIRGASTWDHGHPGYQLPAPGNYHYEAGSRAAGAGRHFRVVPWSNQQRYSPSQQGAFCRESKSKGFIGLNFDIENKLWYERGYLAEFVQTCLGHGLYAVACPKASLGELSGNPHADVGTTDPDAFCQFLVRIGCQAIMPWAYGNHELHIFAYEKARKYFAHENICLLHDTFRENDKGYIGFYAWPRLVAWAKSKQPTPLLGMFEQNAAIQWRGKAHFDATIRELVSLY